LLFACVEKDERSDNKIREVCSLGFGPIAQYGHFVISYCSTFVVALLFINMRVWEASLGFLVLLGGRFLSPTLRLSLEALALSLHLTSEGSAWFDWPLYIAVILDSSCTFVFTYDLG
jgi:hypothetical protein